MHSFDFYTFNSVIFRSSGKLLFGIIEIISILLTEKMTLSFFYTFKNHTFESVFGSAQHRSPLLVLHIMYWYILHSCMTVPRAWARPVAVHIIYSSRVWFRKKLDSHFQTCIILQVLIQFQKIIRL